MNRSRYYRITVSAVRRFHQSENDERVLDEEVDALQEQLRAAETPQRRARLINNIQAIQAYRRVYKDREFGVLTNHRLRYALGEVLVSTQPDLWVTDGKQQVLIKIGSVRKGREYVDVLLTVLRKAAVSAGHKIRARNVIYLDILSGRELICEASLTHFNRSFASTARTIAEIWPTIVDPPTS